MALTVETGAGVPNADSYSTLAYCDQYHTMRGNEAWKASDSAKEQALRKATDYLDHYYGPRLKGAKVSGDQARVWPRTGVDDEDGFAVTVDDVPGRWIMACCEAALLFIGGTDPLAADDPTTTVKREKFDVIEFEYFEPQAGSTARPVYWRVDYLLAPFLNNFAPGIAILDIVRA